MVELEPVNSGSIFKLPVKMAANGSYTVDITVVTGYSAFDTDHFESDIYIVC